MKKAFLALLLVILVAGCIGGGEPSGGRDSARASVPTLGIVRLEHYPAELIAGDVFYLNATVENAGSGEAPLRDVEGEFYNFGSYLDRCSVISGGRYNLGGGDRADFSCLSRVKPKHSWADQDKESISQTVRFKTTYYYDLSLAMDGLTALEEREFERVNPSTNVESKSVGSPFSMEIELDSLPAKEGESFFATMKFSMDLSESQGIEEKGISRKYHVGLATLSIPSSFLIIDQGDFDSKRPCGEFTCLEANYVRLDNGQGSLTAEIKVPRMKQPEDSFSVRAFATSYKIFKIESVGISAESEKLT